MASLPGTNIDPNVKPPPLPGSPAATAGTKVTPTPAFWSSLGDFMVRVGQALKEGNIAQAQEMVDAWKKLNK